MSKPLQGLNTSRTASVICKRIGPVELKCVSQAELELPFGGVGIAFLRDAAESAAGWTGIRVIVVRMVEVIECLRLKDQLMVFVAGYNVHRLLQRGAEAVEARSEDIVTRTSRGERAKRRWLIYGTFKPLCCSGIAREAVGQVRCSDRKSVV